ncbi:BatD family protein [uncultured Alistipes sp.]|uniref:BatD family protein n=1 Tax=uncultured Alistipes sp. TaxID=538949 RepID=UPI0026022222|nr:BatD family protein [uncultured Alistipes sp.]
MRDFLSKISLTGLLLLVVTTAWGAGKVSFEASSPLTVSVGEAFRVEFSLNASPDDDTFKAPSFEGFDVLAGPVLSTGSSVQIVNGSMTRSVSVTYTFVLLPQAAGNVTIGAAEVAVDGTVYRTDPLPVEIVDEGTAAQQRQSPQSGQSGTQAERSDEARSQSEAQGRIGKQDILLRAVVSRTSVYKNEPLHVAFKLYTRVPVVDVSVGSMPSFNGFWSQDLSSNSTTARQGRETFNGKVYETHVVCEYLLYPQQAGTLTIDPMEMTALAQVVVQSRRNIDPFFGSGREVYNVPREVKSQRVTVQVKPLPAGAPASFSGAVGSFTMDAQLPEGRLAANSGATCTVKISGTGNLTFVQAPKLNLPGSFEQYNVKTTESINASSAGISGYRQFEYPFIARAEGTYDVAPIEFSYFDPARMQYVTLSSRPLTLEVTPDTRGGSDGSVVLQGRGMSKEEVKLLGQDIRFIKLGNAQLRGRSVPFLFSGAYWALLAAILVGFGALYAALRKRIRESQNVALVRGRRANKVAVQRFRAARGYMEEQNRHAFYEEMLRALWGYMGDKFNIPVANLTKESVREELHKRGVSAEDAQRFTAIITQCDEAQYSPAASARMSDVYSEGVDLISRIEAVIKR